MAARIRAASGEGWGTCWVVRRRAGSRAPAGIASGEPDNRAAKLRRGGKHGCRGQISLRQGMAGQAEALMRFWGRQFLAISAQMHGAIPIRGADDRCQPSIGRMGQAQRWGQHGLHQQQGGNQAREGEGIPFHGKRHNLARPTCQAFRADLARASGFYPSLAQGLKRFGLQ